MIRPADAYILPDPGGPVVIGAIQRNLGNAIEHEVLLGTVTRTPGQNALSVQVFGRSYRTGEGGPSAAAPTDASIAEEMAQALPGIEMRIAPYFVQNRYGPFGYAVGRGTGRDLCLYGWQRLETQSGSGPFYANRYLLQIRLRLCRSGAGEQELVRVMYSFTLASYFGSQYPDQMITAPPRPESVLGTPREVLPRNPAGPALVLNDVAPMPTSSAAPAAPRQIATAAATPARQTPAVPNAPMIPAPTAALTPPPVSPPVPLAAPGATANTAAGGMPTVPPPILSGGVPPAAPGGDPPRTPSPAMQAITAAREIDLPAGLAREVEE